MQIDSVNLNTSTTSQNIVSAASLPTPRVDQQNASAPVQNNSALSSRIPTTNAEAAFKAALFYTYGSNNPKKPNPIRIDYTKAITYYTLAAQQGHINALYSLASLYTHGRVDGSQADPCKIDYTKAITYFTLAAQRGCVNSLCDLASLHMQGKVEGSQAYPWKIDYAKAMLCFKAYYTTLISSRRNSGIDLSRRQIKQAIEDSTSDKEKSFLTFQLACLEAYGFTQGLITRPPLNAASIIKNLMSNIKDFSDRKEYACLSEI